MTTIVSSSPSTVYTATTYVEQIVRQIPTLFGRLVYVAALWNPDSHCYCYNPLSQIASRTTLDNVLGKLHMEIFQQFLAFNLRQQHNDVMRYVDADEPGCESMLRIWGHKRMLEQLTPPSCMAHERLLFVTELSLLMETLSCSRSQPQ